MNPLVTTHDSGPAEGRGTRPPAPCPVEKGSCPVPFHRPSQ